jgi:hypothetical protein
VTRSAPAPPRPRARRPGGPRAPRSRQRTLEHERHDAPPSSA